ncbi:hypothetical protein [Amaricoccus sp.]|uniref:hypothetical protein n=1 Tax=Amaricoccus sp. TaxID=1872485 RepID=UPI001B7A0586|nr:hypothetical protein [Amaricoccus sp.]MBP7001688.1 hypothetical protein [Amaricoccus sp.]
MLDVADLAAEVRAGGRLAPEPERRRLRAEPPAQAAAPVSGFAQDKRGREIEPGDPIIFAASGIVAGVYLGRYVGRDPTSGSLLAVIEPGEPRAGQRATIVPGAVIRARAEDIRAEARAAIAREIYALGAVL